MIVSVSEELFCVKMDALYTPAPVSAHWPVSDGPQLTSHLVLTPHTPAHITSDLDSVHCCCCPLVLAGVVHSCVVEWDGHTDWTIQSQLRSDKPNNYV